MKKLFSKVVGIVLILSVLACSLYAAPAVFAADATDVHMQVDFLVRDKLGYSFYAYGDGLSEYDSLEIVVDYNHYAYDEETGKNYTAVSKTVTYNYVVGTVIEYDEISAYEMMLGTTFTLNCYKNGTVALTRSGTITYASLVFTTMQSAEDKTVYVDMLNYGAAAQDYFASNNADTDLAGDTAELGLPNANVGDYQQYATPDDLASAELASSENNTFEENGVRIGTALQILSSNRLVWVVDPGNYNVNELSLNISQGGTILDYPVSEFEKVGDYYYFYPDEDQAIPLYEVKVVVGAAIIKDRILLASRNYSVECFVAESMMDGGKLQALGDALMKLSHSVRIVLNLDYSADGECLHTGVRNWQSNQDGTHSLVCESCGELVPEQTGDCIDNDNDGICDACFYLLDVPEEPDYDFENKTYVLKEVTEIEDGKSYYIVNMGNGNVLTTESATGFCWYTNNTKYVIMGDQPSVYDTDNLWTFTEKGEEMYEVTTSDGLWLKPNTMSAEITSIERDIILNVYYDIGSEGWVIYRDFSDYPDMYSPLQVVNDANSQDTAAIGAYETVLGTEYTYWYFYEIVEGVPSDDENGGDQEDSGITNIALSTKLENLAKNTNYDILPVLSSAYALITDATQATDEGAVFVSNTNQTTSLIEYLREETDNRIEEIRASENLTIPSGATVYYVSNSGSDSNSGTSASRPWKTLDKVNSISSSSSKKIYVLFERGGIWRGQLEAKKYVTYSAYGTGDKPKIYASPFDGASDEYADKWTKYATNIWSFQSDEFITESGTVIGDIGTLVFNEGEACAIKIDDYGLTTINVSSMLDSDLEFYHNYKTGTVYLYSKTNPATRFDSIEFNVGKNAVKAASTSVTIDNLCIKYTGAHGVGTASSNSLTVQNCEFGWIGGSIHSISGSSYIRFGNAVEIYGTCNNFYVTDNYIYQVYDAGITQQVTLSSGPGVHKNVLYSGNVIEYCNYSIEYWITSTDQIDGYIDTFLIEDNYMWYAGRGFCEQRPDGSNGSHINGWRFYDRNRAMNYAIRNNVMIDSKDIMINVYSLRYNSDGSDSMPIFNNNIILAKSSTGLGVIEQCEDSSNTSWPKTVSFNANMFSSIDALLYGDIFGFISNSLYSNNQPTF